LGEYCPIISQKVVSLVKSGHFYVLNTGKYRQILAGIGIGIPVSVYTGLETLLGNPKRALISGVQRIF
jgi:hypothetical protein